MDIQQKQAKWKQERPLFEAEFIHSHLLPFFNFNENTGDYEIKSEFSEDEDRKLAYEILNTGWVMWLRAKRDAKNQAVPEGFVLVPTKNVSFFSHDFNGDGFQYHDTLVDAKKAAEADLDIYRDRVADGNHIAEMGEFNELSYGIVVGQAEWSVDCVVSAEDHKNGEYTQYDIGTEILSLYLNEAQEQGQ